VNTHYLHQSGLHFVTDIGLTLQVISEGVTSGGTWSDGSVTTAQDKMADDFQAEDAWGPGVIIETCRETLPRNTIATVDSGAHRILLSQKWQCYEPRSLLQSSALCTMGCAVPLAMGASLVDPDRPVVSFSGDAGMLMVAGELSTASELGLKTIFVVFVDACLSLIELKQRQRQMKNAGVDFAKHDFAALGQSLGGGGHTVSSRDQLVAALEAAQTSDTFTVIAAAIDQGAYDGRI
jgi:acetolactate synthase-1/2/3 large subunit